jgi:hypothetical protein
LLAFLLCGAASTLAVADALAQDQPEPAVHGLAALQAGDLMQYTQPGRAPIRARLAEISGDGAVLTVEREGRREPVVLAETDTVSKLERRRLAKRGAVLGAVKWGVIGFVVGLTSEAACLVPAPADPETPYGTTCDASSVSVPNGIVYGAASAAFGAVSGAGLGSFLHETVAVRIWGLRQGEEVRLRSSQKRAKGRVTGVGGEPGAEWIDVETERGAPALRFELASLERLEVRQPRDSRFLTGARLGAIEGALIAGIGYTIECTGDHSTCSAGKVLAGTVGGMAVLGILTGALNALHTPWDRARLGDAKVSLGVQPTRGGAALGLRVSWK